MWLELTLYTISVHYKNGKRIVFLEPCQTDVFKETSDKTRIFENYLCSALGESLTFEARNIIEMNEELATLVEAMFEIDEREEEIWEKAKDLASEPELLIDYLHTVLLARRLGRNE
jgi:hypothetical protein